jgi:hypothetical protein
MSDDFFDTMDNDYIVRVRPTVVDNEWTGDIDIAILTSASNQLDDESYHQLMHFTKMMCAAVPLMEHSEEIRNFAHEYVMEEIDKDGEPVVSEPDVTFTEEDGNVIRLNFGTAIKGSA